jgi:drug/metabolite transporter (DMT)-like permease
MPARAIVQSLCAILLWSVLAFLALQLSRVPPFLLIGIALCTGALCGVHKASRWRVPVKVLLLGVYGLFGFHFCLFMALRLAPAVEANLVNYLWPLLIVALTPVFLRGYTLKARHVVAACLGLGGAFLVVSGGTLHFDTAALPGYLLAAASAFIWASYSLLTKRVASFANAAIGLFCLCSGVLSLGVHFLFEPRYAFAWRDLPLLLALGLGPMGAAFFLWDAALKNGDPRVIGSFAYLTPLLSTLLLVITGSGRFSLVSVVAMVMIVGGSVLGAAPTASPGRARPGSSPPGS